MFMREKSRVTAEDFVGDGLQCLLMRRISSGVFRWSQSHFPYNLASAQVPIAANSAGLTFIEHGRIEHRSGLDYYLGLSATSFDSSAGYAALQSLGEGQAQTMTTAEFQNLHLISGEKLVIDYSYYPGDYHDNDFAFAMLKDASGTVTPLLLADENNIVATDYQTHFLTTYTIGPTWNRITWMVVPPPTPAMLQETSDLVIHGISVQVPTGDYTLTGNGVQLSDGSILNADGSLALPGGGTETDLLSSSAADLVTKLDNLVNAGLVGEEDGSSLVGEDGSSVISNDGGSLIGEDGSSLVGPDGTPLISADNGNLISQDATTWADPAERQRPDPRCKR